MLLRTAAVPVFRGQFLPGSLLVVDTVLGFGGLLGLRAVCRSLNENCGGKRKAHPAGHKRSRILLIGAGRAGMMAARELRYQSSAEYEIAGFLDDDPLKQGSVIQGLKVLGPIEELSRLAKELHFDHVVITIAAASRLDISRILKLCASIRLKAQRIPSVDEVLLGKVEIGRLREVRLEDLLAREPVHFDEQCV